MLKKQWLLAMLVSTALAATSPAALARKHRISAEEAASIANSVVQGRVVDVDFERRKNGRDYYEVEIRKDGRDYEVHVDAKTGRIIGGQNDVEVYPDNNGDVYPHTDDSVRIYPDNNHHYDPHGYYGYYGKHGHGDGYYDDDDDDDDDD